VAVRFTAHGIHKGDFMGLPATGKPITMTGIEIFRIKDGKIAELWGGRQISFGLMPTARDYSCAWGTRGLNFVRLVTSFTIFYI